MKPPLRTVDAKGLTGYENALRTAEGSNLKEPRRTQSAQRQGFSFPFRAARVFRGSRSFSRSETRSGSDPALFGQFGGFLLVGACNTLLDFGIFNLLTAVAGVGRIPANVTSVSVALVMSFVLNGKLVFRSLPHPSLARFVQFVGVTAFSGLVIQNVVIHAVSQAGLERCLVREWSCSAGLAQWLAADLSKCLAVGAGLVWNFSWYKWFVFRLPQDQPARSCKRTGQ